MTPKISQTVTVLADLTDPTSDGILNKLVTYGLAALMVIVALLGGWYAVKAWMDKKGKDAMAEMRTVVFGVIVVEAILGGIIVVANRGSQLIPQLLS